MARTPYSKLHLAPDIIAKCVCGAKYNIAKCVCGAKYNGTEVSDAVRNMNLVSVVEDKRIHMSSLQIMEFAHQVNERCKAAYEAKAKWFDECLKGESGRDQLYMWVTHWLASFLMKESFDSNVHDTCTFYVCYDPTDTEDDLPFIATNLLPHYTIAAGPLTGQEASFALSREIGLCGC